MSPRYKGTYENEGGHAPRDPQHRANVDVTKRTFPPFDVQTNDLLIV
jgi:hypothetical protein